MHMSEERLHRADAGPEARERHLALLPEAPVAPVTSPSRPDEPVLRAGIRAGAIGFFAVAALYTVVGLIAGLGIGGALGVGGFVGFWGGIGWGAMTGTSLFVMRDHSPPHVSATVPVQDHRTTRRGS
jgi:hypothetical protein